MAGRPKIKRIPTDRDFKIFLDELAKRQFGPLPQKKSHKLPGIIFLFFLLIVISLAMIWAEVWWPHIKNLLKTLL